MHLSQAQLLLGLLVAVVGLLGGLWKVAAALVRAGAAGQHLSDQLVQNTQATDRLTQELGDVTTWRHATDTRLDRLERRQP